MRITLESQGQGHKSGVVHRSRLKFGRSRILTPVTAICTVLIQRFTGRMTVVHSFKFGIRPIRNESEYITTIVMIIPLFVGQSEIRKTVKEPAKRCIYTPLVHLLYTRANYTQI